MKNLYKSRINRGCRLIHIALEVTKGARLGDRTATRIDKSQEIMKWQQGRIRPIQNPCAPRTGNGSEAWKKMEERKKKKQPGTKSWKIDHK